MPKPREEDARRAIDDCANDRVKHARAVGEKGVTFESERKRFEKIANDHDRRER